jgi:hypothetical protein
LQQIANFVAEFDIRLKIRLKSGKVEQFIIDKEEILYKKRLNGNN